MSHGEKAFSVIFAGYLTTPLDGVVRVHLKWLVSWFELAQPYFQQG